MDPGFLGVVAGSVGFLGVVAGSVGFLGVVVGVPLDSAGRVYVESEGVVHDRNGLVVNR